MPAGPDAARSVPLQVLRLDSNNLADLSGLIRMPRLAEFYAAENARLTTAAHDVAQSLPGLEFLDLAGCPPPPSFVLIGHAASFTPY